MYSILLVDDEPSVLNMLKKTLSGQPYKIHSANSANEGLAKLEKAKVELIISDMIMPEINGLEFLEKANSISPDSIKMILSGQSNIDNIVDAVNSGLIWKYIIKPWNGKELIITISNGLKYYQVKQDNANLISKLTYSNSLLSKQNALLESEVRKRTQQISKINKILIQLLDGIPVEELLNNIVDELISLLGTDNVAIIIPGESEYCYFPEDYDRKDQIDEIIDIVSSNRETYCKNDVFAIPIIDDNALYSVLLAIGNGIDHKALQKEIKSISTLIKFAVQRFKLIGQTAKIIDNIDNLLEY